MTQPDAVLLFDGDSTLLNNDRVGQDLRRHIERIGDRVNYDLTALLGDVKADKAR
jgi:hypothetical protein